MQKIRLLTTGGFLVTTGEVDLERVERAEAVRHKNLLYRYRGMEKGELVFQQLNGIYELDGEDPVPLLLEALQPFAEAADKLEKKCGGAADSWDSCSLFDAGISLADLRYARRTVKNVG